MESEEALNTYRAAFREAFDGQRLQLKDSRSGLKDPVHSEFTDASLYEESYVDLKPSGGREYKYKNISRWRIKYRKLGSALELLILLNNSEATLIWAAFAAVHTTVPSRLLYFKDCFVSREYSDIISNHPKVLQVDKGFVNAQGSVKIMFQLQYIPKKPRFHVHPLHRTFLMEVYWLRKDIIDKTFSDVLETAKKTFTEHKKKLDWKNYLSYLKGIGKFSMKKDVMGKHLLKLCNNDDLLAGILMSGSEQLYSKDGSFLLKSTENEFCLKDKLGFDDALSRASDMNYLALNRLTPGNFTFECVKSFEKKLLKNCWNVFQLSFLKLKVTETYLNFESMKVNTDVNPGDGEVPADAEPAVTQGPEAVIQGLDDAEQAVIEPSELELSMTRA